MKVRPKSQQGRIVSFAVLVTMIMILSSVAVVTADGTRQEEELILRVAMQDDIKTLNPLTAGDVWTWNVVGYLYDGPLNVDPETDELVPYIAVGSANTSTTIDYEVGELSWDDCDIGTFGYTPKSTWKKEVPTSNVGETILFYDFTNVIWHDGVQMTIRDILFSYHVCAQVPEWSSSMNCLKDNGGRTGSNYSTTSWLNIYKVWESDDGMRAALKFVMTEPFADFFRNTLAAFLIPYHIWGSTQSGQNVDDTKIFCDPGYDVDADNAWKVDIAQAWDNSYPIGNGPFEWSHWDKGSISKITTWRDHFYKPGFEYDTQGKAKQPTIDAIVFKIYKTAEAAVLALKNDDIDFIAWSVPPTFVQELANEPGIALQQSPEQGFFYLSYNMRMESFGYYEDKSFPYSPEDDHGKPFRKAVAHCIDKNRIVQRLLLNFGIAGEGPVSSVSPWFNSSIPRYQFDPEEAINILEAAGYELDDPGSPPGPTNHWKNPGGTPISEESDGQIKILTPEANYDPIRAQAGLMIAQQLQDVGINAKSEAMDFGSIVDRIDQRDFEMYILGWRIGSDPTDFLHAFFHSSTAAAGQNYPGYQNQSFDQVIDLARQTGVEAVRKQAIFDSQAAIAYDLPYDVLYYRTNIEAYRSDRFTGWSVGSTGSIYNWRSIMNIRAPSPYKTNAKFVSPPSAMESNATSTITIQVVDQDREPLNGAFVELNASSGTLGALNGTTSANGKFTTTFTAPYVAPTTDAVNNGTSVIIQISEATYSVGETEYDPAPSRLTLVTVYPEDVPFLSVMLSADPDVIDPDINEDGSLGFTYVEVTVENQDGDPASGVTVAVEVSPAIPTIDQEERTTDADGKATFKITAVDETEDDGSNIEYMVIAKAFHPTDTSVKSGENNLRLYVVDKEKETGGGGGTPFPSALVIASTFCIAAVAFGVIRKMRK